MIRLRAPTVAGMVAFFDVKCIFELKVQRFSLSTLWSNSKLRNFLTNSPVPDPIPTDVIPCDRAHRELSDGTDFVPAGPGAGLQINPKVGTGESYPIF